MQHQPSVRDGFLASLEQFRCKCEASLRDIEKTSKHLTALYGDLARNTPPQLSHSAISATLNGRRASLPAWKWISAFLLCCHHLSTSQTTDDPAKLLADWRQRWDTAQPTATAPLAASDVSGPDGPAPGPADIGDAEHAYRGGVLLATHGHVEEAMRCLERAHEAGHPGAAELLAERADALLAGAHALAIAEQLERADFEAAVPYYERAAECRMVRAAVKLGIGYKARGETTRMAHWFAVAAYMGDTLAQYQLEQHHRETALAQQDHSSRSAPGVSQLRPRSHRRPADASPAGLFCPGSSVSGSQHRHTTIRPAR